MRSRSGEEGAGEPTVKSHLSIGINNSIECPWSITILVGVCLFCSFFLFFFTGFSLRFRWCNTANTRPYDGRFCRYCRWRRIDIVLYPFVGYKSEADGSRKNAAVRNFGRSLKRSKRSNIRQHLRWPLDTLNWNFSNDHMRRKNLRTAVTYRSELKPEFFFYIGRQTYKGFITTLIIATRGVVKRRIEGGFLIPRVTPPSYTCRSFVQTLNFNSRTGFPRDIIVLRLLPFYKTYLITLPIVSLS